ncbi:DUF2059 domain-containing protein [Kovacikia minuta CCNUW1]|uniref:DUF2059 domain-containing protein n=1 Tax=Kovacikia minuta TaxID=2931930 RepID=UPI001CC91A98|nr:DUF2059 domain-containing protein [Kovacikia minuta]UBF27905.1 DUF2059 domain-containing protein [Kovacikia minuta CCNUW1]
MLTTCAATSQQKTSKEVSENPVTKIQSRRELAREVLRETGISQKYNLYLGNSVDLGLPFSTRNSKYREWLQAVLAREAGWAKIEDKYIARLEADFSESELKELLNLSRQPLMKRLLQNEMQAYVDSSEERRKLLSQVWDDYNSGKINPPPEVMP